MANEILKEIKLENWHYPSSRLTTIRQCGPGKRIDKYINGTEQNKEPRNSPLQIQLADLWQRSKSISMEKRTVFSTNGSETSGHPPHAKKMNPDIDLPYIFHKN